MEQQKIKQAFLKLGEVLRGIGNQESWPGYEVGLTQEEWEDTRELVDRIHHHNGWFTADQVRNAFQGIGSWLHTDKLDTWLSQYTVAEKSLSIGVINAGNIPLVGFHDFLCVLLAGHRYVGKLASEDLLLLPHLFQLLVKFDPELEGVVSFVDRIDKKTVDRVIATGSNNTARYFEHYLQGIPTLIRKGRTSVAVLNGEEREEELEALGKDIFQYFGLGCRNVTKLFIPEDFDLNRFFKAVFPYQDIVNHNKYANNYDYHKAIYLMEQIKIVENGFLLLKEDKESLYSPVGVLFYERYTDEGAVRQHLKEKAEEIQCIVSTQDVPFGKAQAPELSDYADGIDTFAFLQA